MGTAKEQASVAASFPIRKISLIRLVGEDVAMPPTESSDGSLPFGRIEQGAGGGGYPLFNCSENDLSLSCRSWWTHNWWVRREWCRGWDRLLARPNGGLRHLGGAGPCTSSGPSALARSRLDGRSPLAAVCSNPFDFGLSCRSWWTH